MVTPQMIEDVRHRFWLAKLEAAKRGEKANFVTVLLAVVSDKGYRGEEVGPVMAELASAYAEDRKQRRKRWRDSHPSA